MFNDPHCEENTFPTPRKCKFRGPGCVNNLTIIFGCSWREPTENENNHGRELWLTFIILFFLHHSLLETASFPNHRILIRISIKGHSSPLPYRSSHMIQGSKSQ